MALASTNLTTATRLGNLVESVFEWLARVGENSSRGRAVAKLNALTDEQLAARGTTRAAEARRLLSPHYDF